ncbi:translocation/assembly module TamB domain-containing protein [Anianabacter salinae]|uniref:translocation/assembly module TamB domain-containing protein n=1 Tax=Anianabacter salinae TaxID=2851023 RepID=UPI00225E04FB|nr:translocation/assembly module TamB domain-containing protein [Anianabacter salinae]MBV0912437.1 translocation/assembly module TamB domain-containing protein [Anianabacter salinae]
MRWCAALAVAGVLATGPSFAQDDGDDGGRGLLEGFLEDALSSAGRDVNIIGFRGALSSRATVERLTISDGEGIWLTVENAVLDWNRSAVLAGRIEVRELTADRIEVLRPPVTEAAVPSAAAPGFSLPELPVSVDIDQLSIPRIELGEAFLGEPVALAVEGSAQLAGGEGEAALSIDRIGDAEGRFVLDASYANETGRLALDLSLEEGAGGIAARLLQIPGAPPLSLTIEGDDPVSDFTAEIMLATEGTPRVTGTVTRDAAGEGAAETSVDIRGDLRPLTAPQYHEFLGEAVALSAIVTQGSDGSTGLRQLQLETGATRLTGQLELAPDGWPSLVDISGRIETDGRVTLPVAGGDTELGEADLSISYDAARGDRWAARIAARRLMRPEFSAERLSIVGLGTIERSGDAVSALRGTVRLDGTGLDAAVPALARALGDALGGSARVQWSDAAPLRLQDIDISGSDYRLQGDLRLTGENEDAPFASALDLQLSADDLSRFSGLAGREIGGGANLGLDGTVSPLAGGFDLGIQGMTRDLTLAIPELDGLIGGETEIEVNVARDETGLRFDTLSLDGRGVTIRGDGAFGTDSGQADLTLILPDLSRIRPELSGQAQLRTDLALDDGRIAAQITGSGPGALALDLEAAAPFDYDTGLGVVDAKGQFSAEDLSAYAELAGQDLAGRVSLEASAKFNPDTGALALAAQGSGRDLGVGIDVADRILAGRADLNLTVERAPDGTLRIEDSRIQTPQLTATVSGEVAADTALVRFDTRLANLGLVAPGFNGPLSVDGTVTRATNGSFEVSAQGTGPGGVTATVGGTLAPDFGTADLNLRGTAPLALANTFIAPRLLSGTARFDLGLNGPLAVNFLSGRITSNGAGLVLPSLGLSLTGIGADVSLGRGRANLDITGGLSTGGTLRLTGPVTLSGGYSADLSLALNQLVLTEPGLYETTADGSLSIDGPLTGGAAISGQINLGQTELRVPSGGGPDVAGLDIRHVNEPADVRASRRRAGLIVSDMAGNGGNGAGAAYPVDIRIYAPNRIFLRGRGLDAELGGSLRLRGTTADVITEGEFSLVRGRLDILGRRLLLTQALVRLQGDFDPFVRIAAESRTEDVLVRFVIEGPASSPDLAITSQPDLPQETALSLFLFGRNPEEISAVQALQLAAAIRTLAGSGGEGLIGNLREALGVDDLDIAQGEDGTVGLRAGRYLSENIYSDVTVDAEGRSRINLNLEVSPSVTARGTAGSDGSTGLGIFFERDY